MSFIMIKGATTNLAFLTDILGCGSDEYEDLTQEGRRRATENNLRKFKGNKPSVKWYLTRSRGGIRAMRSVSIKYVVS